MADQNETEVEVQKTVTIVGYLSDQSWGSWREWSDSVDEDKDYCEQDTKTETNYKLKGRGFETHITESEYNTLRNNHTGELEVVKEETETQSHKWGSQGGKSVIKNEVKNALRNDSTLTAFNKKFGSSWENDEGDTVFGLYTTAKDMGLLKHPSEMDEDDPWEDEDADLMAIRLKVNIRNVSEDVAETLSDGPVKTIIEVLKDNDHIGRVRWTDCETKKVEKGACYNI